MSQTVAAFIENVEALDSTVGEWTYYLDLLGLIERHRQELQGQGWPDGFDMVEADTYRILLLVVEDLLRELLLTVPPGNPDADMILAAFANEMRDFLDRAKAVSERLGGAQVH